MNGLTFTSTFHNCCCGGESGVAVLGPSGLGQAQSSGDACVAVSAGTSSKKENKAGAYTSKREMKREREEK